MLCVSAEQLSKLFRRNGRYDAIRCDQWKSNGFPRCCDVSKAHELESYTYKKYAESDQFNNISTKTLSKSFFFIFFSTRSQLSISIISWFYCVLYTICVVNRVYECKMKRKEKVQFIVIFSHFTSFILIIANGSIGLLSNIVCRIVCSFFITIVVLVVSTRNQTPTPICFLFFSFPFGFFVSWKVRVHIYILRFFRFAFFFNSFALFWFKPIDGSLCRFILL